jgi:ectoine hydroxylase-related dioxygenase (phytanoyl-CoA dioxygenase family)
MRSLDPRDPGFEDGLRQDLEHQGYGVVAGVLSDGVIELTRSAMYRVRARLHDELGEERLRRAGEIGVLRLMMLYEDVFFSFLSLPEVLAVVDATVGEAAVLHLQNGFILPSEPAGASVDRFQSSFHRDFPRYMSGFVASVNVLFAVDAFTATNGATVVVPGSHQRAEAPTPQYMAARAVPVECPAGSMVVFDSTLWHAAGRNTSGQDRLAINHQFTRSYLKQQIDYVRALGDARVTAQAPRTQQLLGWYTRVVTSLDEYYRPEAERLYRKGQG